MILGLFFTRGISLKLWVESGLFDREKLIYEEHLNQGNLKKVYWFTYGHLDIEVANQLKEDGMLHKEIKVLSMPKLFVIPKIGSWLYSFLLVFIYKDRLKECDVLKTNQIDGSWVAVYAKKLFKKPVIIRTGYTITQLLKNKKSFFLKIKLYKIVEKYAYKNADAAVVSSCHNKRYLEQEYQFNNIKVMTNYIDTKRFYNHNSVRYDNRILFVGRLNKEKNIFNLIKAISKTQYILDIYGHGELKKDLEDFSVNLNANVNFKGTIQNSELCEIYNRYKYYALVSFFEGMPKTLLEAMACGCQCIGTNVTGINEVIENKINGILIDGVEYKAIYNALKTLNNYDFKSLSKNAEQTIFSKFSFQSVVLQEKEIINGLVKYN
jgi:glycosyltransferase involved in cell wall biosynthesis